ncbi:MAG TPA: exopolysaccharide production protein, partial [Microbacteriaceae bacterium]|nr:exopolysaccharide production protein [Microbacteriaceae bacterium]
LVAAYVFRAPLLQALDARSIFSVRYNLWLQIWHLNGDNPLVGWGWSGLWWRHIPPYDVLNFLLGTAHDSALDAYLDVYLQVGLAGLVLFGLMVALAFGRAWVVASNKRTVVYTWAPLVLVALIVTSVLDSTMLVDWGWLLLVVCCVKASQSLSWRHRLPVR